MQIVVLAAAEQKAQLTNGVAQEVVWIKEEKEFLHYPSADVFIDLAYINTPERNAVLTRLLPRLVVINAVADTLQETNAAFVRVNGWTTFLSSPVLEAACNNSDSKAKAEEVGNARFRQCRRRRPIGCDRRTSTSRTTCPAHNKAQA